MHPTPPLRKSPGHVPLQLLLLLCLSAQGLNCGPDASEHSTRGSALSSEADRINQARAANLAGTRARLKPVAQAEFDRILARLPDDLLVWSSTTSPSQVLGTGGGDLLPSTCSSFVSSSPPDYEGAARCFIAANPSLMLDGPEVERGTAPELVLLSNEPGGLPSPPEQYLRFEQRHRGFLVEKRSMAFAFVDRRLVTSAGRYAGTHRFQDAVVDERALEERVHLLFGPAVEPGEFVYNPDSGQLELIVREGFEEHRVNAVTGAHASTTPAGNGLEVTKNVGVYQYYTGGYLGTSNSTTLIPSPVTCVNGAPGTCDVGGSGICRYYPRQTAVADRVSQVNVTYEPPVTVPPTPPLETTVFEDDPCGNANVFVQSPWTSQYYLQHYAASARRNLDEVADVMLHSESFFWVYPRTPYTTLKLNINATNQFEAEWGAGLYTTHDQKINLAQDPSPGGTPFARNLDAIAHEYGHYWHHTYGSAGEEHLEEGWADHFPLRVAIHRRFVTGAWSSLSYFTELNHFRGHRIIRTRRKGEWIADQYPPAVDPLWLSYGSAYCPDDWYTCGALLGVTYWLLAFDTCRINYNGCTNGADIIRFNGGYQNSAWRLANSAYAYAIKNVSGSADLAEFHTLVSQRYAYFYNLWYIDLADRNRVDAVLGAHCLGPVADCAGKHRLPGSTLPSAHTEKDALFYEAEDAVLYFGAAVGSGANSGSSDAYVVLGSTGEAWFAVNPTQTGAYRIHFVMKPKNASYDEVRVRDPVTGIWRLVGPLNQPWYGLTWDWRTRTDGTADVTFTTTGSQWLAFKTAPSHTSFILDAIWLEKL